MGEHIDNRKNGIKKRKKTYEGVDPLARANRVTFKSYLRQVEEDLANLEADLVDEDLEDDQDQ